MRQYRQTISYCRGKQKGGVADVTYIVCVTYVLLRYSWRSCHLPLFRKATAAVAAASSSSAASLVQWHHLSNENIYYNGSNNNNNSNNNKTTATTIIMFCTTDAASMCLYFIHRTNRHCKATCLVFRVSLYDTRCLYCI